MSTQKNTPPKSFRDVPVKQRSIWESWAVLPAKTRLRISLAVTGFALAGMYISNQLEQTLPPPKEGQIAGTGAGAERT